jgi:hypothetical protein
MDRLNSPSDGSPSNPPDILPIPPEDKPRTLLSTWLETLLPESPRTSRESSRPSTPPQPTSTRLNEQASQSNTMRSTSFPIRAASTGLQRTPSSSTRAAVSNDSSIPAARRLGSERRTLPPIQVTRGEEDTSQAISEALADDLDFQSPPPITPPPHAHLPHSSAFTHTRDNTFQPPYLGSLTRSTLPTSSLTAVPAQVHAAPHSEPSTMLYQQSTPSRTSLDSLRTLKDRGMHTSATAAAPQAPFVPSPISRWWFQPENKKTVDRMLDEDDQSSTVEKEGEKIRQKCKPSFYLPIHPDFDCPIRPFYKESGGVLSWTAWIR